METFWAFVEAAGALATGEVVRDVKEILAQHRGKPWTFVSYRNSPGKLGINPRYSWGFTANGVYGYKLDDALNIPGLFADKYAYVIVFTVKEAAKPYVVDLEEADQRASGVSGLVPKPTELGSLDEGRKQRLSQVYAAAIPDLPGFFERVLKMGERHKIVIKPYRPVSGFVDQILKSFQTGKDAEMGQGSDYWESQMSANTKASMAMWRALTSLGFRGYFAGETEAARSDYEVAFFYPTDLQVLGEYNVARNVIGTNPADQTARFNATRQSPEADYYRRYKPGVKTKLFRNQES